jgi:hypothetical protein
VPTLRRASAPLQLPATGDWMHIGEFGWALARWNLVVLIVAATLTFALLGTDFVAASGG